MERWRGGHLEVGLIINITGLNMKTLNSKRRIHEARAEPANDNREHRQLALVKKALRQISVGKSPSIGPMKGATPGYWIIRTNGPELDADDRVEESGFVHDVQSMEELAQWAERGGRMEMIRERFDFWVAVRMINMKSGASCIGINYPSKGGARKFALIEGEMASKPKLLRKHLRERGAVFDDDTWRKDAFLPWLLETAPCIVVMPDVPCWPTFSL